MSRNQCYTSSVHVNNWIPCCVKMLATKSQNMFNMSKKNNHNLKKNGRELRFLLKIWLGIRGSKTARCSCCPKCPLLIVLYQPRRVERREKGGVREEGERERETLGTLGVSSKYWRATVSKPTLSHSLHPPPISIL